MIRRSAFSKVGVSDPHFHSSIREILKATLLDPWTRRVGTANEEWMKWPPYSPDLTARHSLLWVKLGSKYLCHLY